MIKNGNQRFGIGPEWKDFTIMPNDKTDETINQSDQSKIQTNNCAECGDVFRVKIKIKRKEDLLKKIYKG